MNIVIAPDSFKGTLSQAEVAYQMKRGLQTVIPEAQYTVKPMADGGEGTLHVISRHVGKSDEINLSVTGPLGKKINSRFIITNENIAIIEVAKVIGLPLIRVGHLTPFKTTTYGLGEVITKALNLGVRRFVIGLGGSATIDGGFAMLQSLGAEFTNDKGETVSKYGKSLQNISVVDISALDKRLSECTFTLVGDVPNPLYGRDGATAIFGPQKGVKKEQVLSLDGAMEHYARLMMNAINVQSNLSKTAGAGAAGGLGFAFLLLGGEIVQGSAYIAKETNLAAAIKRADVVFTGEGKSDSTTIAGKAPGYVAKLAKKHNVPCILVSGMIADKEMLINHFTQMYSLVDGHVTFENAMNQPRETLVNKMKIIAEELKK